MSVANLKSYDPALVIGSFFGATAHGFADGQMISVKMLEDKWTAITGADGEVTRVKNQNEQGEIEIVLKQSSTFNDILSAALDANTVGPVLIKDLSGTSLHQAVQAWVKKAPDAGYGKELDNRTWTISCARLIPFVGGIPS